MTVSRNGQVSIPSATRARWRANEDFVADKVVVVDMGDHIVVGPALKDPVRQLRGKYAGRGPSSEEMRREAREEDAESEAKREFQRKARSKRPRTA